MGTIIDLLRLLMNEYLLYFEWFVRISRYGAPDHSHALAVKSGEGGGYPEIKIKNGICEKLAKFDSRQIKEKLSSKNIAHIIIELSKIKQPEKYIWFYRFREIHKFFLHLPNASKKFPIAKPVKF